MNKFSMDLETLAGKEFGLAIRNNDAGRMADSVTAIMQTLATAIVFCSRGNAETANRAAKACAQQLLAAVENTATYAERFKEGSSGDGNDGGGPVLH